MSNVLLQIAAIHRERCVRHEKKRLIRQHKLERRQAYFRDSGIPEMWADVKDIVIKNPVPDVLEGFSIPLSALMHETDETNIQQTGLVLRYKNDCLAQWIIEDHSNAAEEQPKIVYQVIAGKTNWCRLHDYKNVKEEFCASFVKWLSRHITAPMLAEMDIKFETPSIVKRSRKILQLTEI